MPTTPPEQNVLAKTMIYWPMRRLLSHSSCYHGFAPALRISSWRDLMRFFKVPHEMADIRHSDCGGDFFDG